MPKNLSNRSEMIFGRKPDLNHLLERNKRPGVTAIVSRAQMGKSTLLLELARMLSDPAPASLLGQKSCLVGYSSADQVSDPVLYAIQDLYARWLANSSYAQQANSLYKRHKESLIDRLGESTGTIFEKLSKAAGKPLEATAGIVKAVLDGLVRTDQDLKTGGLQLPLLPMEQGRNLLQVVHTISECPLVLILDAWERSRDLNAQIGILASFVRSFDEWPPCHIFLASREDPEPLVWLRDLEAEFPFDVEVFPLDLMHLDEAETRAKLLEFVHEKVPVTQELTDVEVLELISGYPEVIHRWSRSPHIRSLGRLKELSRDAHNYRFAELKKLLPTLEGAQRTLALRLALLPASSSTIVWKSLESKLMEEVSPLDRDALCRKLVLESATPPSYGHTRRSEAALEYILADAPTELTEVAEKLIFQLASSPKDIEASSLVRLNALSTLRLSTGSQVLCLSALTFYEPFVLDPSLVIAARVEFGRDLSSVASLLSFGLFGSSYHAQSKKDFPRRDALLQELRTLADTFPNNATVRKWLAKGLFNTLTFAKQEDDLLRRDALLLELGALTDAFADDTAVRSEFARGLVNALSYAREEGNLPRRDALLQEVRALATTFPNDAAVREQIARGLRNTLSDLQNEHDLLRRDGLLQELRVLANAFPDDAAVREHTAKGLLYTLIDAKGEENLPRRRPLLQELRDLAVAFPNDAVVREQLARGLFITLNNAKEEDAPPGRGVLLQELHTLAITFSSDTAVRESLAKALFNMLIFATEEGDLERRDSFLQELRTTAAAFPNDAAVREWLANSFLNALNHAKQEGDFERRDALLQELRALFAISISDAAVRRCLAYGFYNTLIDTKQEGDLQRKDMLLQELRALAQASDDDTVVREEFTKALLGGFIDACREAHLSLRESLFQELRALSIAYPDDTLLSGSMMAFIEGSRLETDDGAR